MEHKTAIQMDDVVYTLIEHDNGKNVLYRSQFSLQGKFREEATLKADIIFFADDKVYYKLPKEIFLAFAMLEKNLLQLLSASDEKNEEKEAQHG